MSLRHYDVLLLSAAPEMYAPMLDSLTSIGIPATAACSPQDASRLIERCPQTVLVDLVNGAGIDPATIEAINRRRGNTVVLALHAGGLGPYTELLWDLSVDGFCRYDDWSPIVEVIPQTFALH